MKKLLGYFSVVSLCSVTLAYAQNTSVQPTSDAAPAMERPNDKMREKMKERKEERKEERMERFKNASPEQKERMQQRHEMMEKLTPEQRVEVRKERERHFEEMKRITGSDKMAPMPHQRPEGARMGGDVNAPKNNGDVPMARPKMPMKPSSNQ